VTKKEIVKEIAERLGMTQLRTKEIVQLTFDAIIDTLIENDDHRIELRNFGVFQVKRRAARNARNPRTNERVAVPPKNVVTFKPGKRMEELVRKLENVPLMGKDEKDGEDEDAMVGAGKGPTKPTQPK
jgi:integration host factor subunit beta